VQDFVQRYRAKYNGEPDTFAARAYDAMIISAEVMRRYGVTRQAVHDGLKQIKDVPSLIFGKVQFDRETRRVAGARSVYLVVKDNQFTQWDGAKPLVASK
jgi:branched-chain amino acid transport system substrate-binding protein